MGRKVFISFLGTNNYVNVVHQFPDGTVTKPSRFVQEAILDKIASDWTENDKIFIFLTDEARKKNWDNEGQKFITEECEKIGLKQILDVKSYGKLCISKPIEEGYDNKEIWSIFQTVYDLIEIEDEVYFDITHAFRSIPIFTNTLLNYARFLKKIKVESIYYGAFEKLGYASDVKKMPIEQRIAPVLNLIDIVQLQDWAFAASHFLVNGKTNKIIELIKIDNASLRDNSPEIKLLNNIQTFFETCRSKLIYKGKEFVAFKNYLKTFKSKTSIKPLKEILDVINTKIEGFEENQLINVSKSVKWCYDYGMYQQAITIGQEFVLSIVIELFFDDLKLRNNKKIRSAMNSFLVIDEETYQNEEAWERELKDYRDVFRNFTNHDLILRLRIPECVSLVDTGRTVSYYYGLSEIRNKINHGGVTDDVTPEKFIKGFCDVYNYNLHILNSYGSKYNDFL